MDSLTLLTAVIGLVIGALIAWLITRNFAATDQGPGELAVEITTTKNQRGQGWVFSVFAQNNVTLARMALTFYVTH